MLSSFIIKWGARSNIKADDSVAVKNGHVLAIFNSEKLGQTRLHFVRRWMLAQGLILGGVHSTSCAIRRHYDDEIIVLANVLKTNDGWTPLYLDAK